MSMYRKSPLTLSGAALALGSVLIVQGALAQTRDTVEAPVTSAGADGGKSSDVGYVRQWHGLIGLGVGARPRYPGASDRKTQLLPVGRITYDRFFIGEVAQAGPGIGAHLYRDAQFSVSAGIAQSIGKLRDESDAARLRGLGDVKGTTWAGVQGEFTSRWFKAGLSVASDIGGNHLGTVATLSAYGRLHPAPAVELYAGPKIIYANDSYNTTLFGVSAAQSAASGLRPYEARAGIVQNAIEIGVNWQLRPDWMVGARVSAGRLAGDAADSPVVEKKSQASGALFAAYRF